MNRFSLRTFRHASLMLSPALVALGLLLAKPASARPLHAVIASFTAVDGRLTVFGDSLDNTISIDRSASGQILVNGGAVAIQGGTATVANTTLIQVFGQGRR